MVASGIVLALSVASGTAFAVFTATATGTGVATVGTAKAVDVTAIVGSPALQPGSFSNLALTITNPNPYAVTITGIEESGTAATVSVTGGTGCTGTDAGVSVPADTSLDITVHAGSHRVVVSTAAMMSSASANGCQGAMFHVPVKVEVKRQ
jgi:hypothetical protein